MAAPRVGSRLERLLKLDAAGIKSGAQFVGDMNPLHHDDTQAAASRYGELIASGAHTSALLAGMLGSGFGDEGSDLRGQVGVDYRVQFRRPIRIDREMRMEWVVVAHEAHGSGTMARLEGRVVDIDSGKVAIEATLSVLYF
ncbi:MaoC/PaaZ C-terminal domain-containing protein [Acidisphaera sp. L21]|uniref:MaoC family dehydratase n=1 Tax=Acidisphaera sp. L21 TaxID=1641851 RepID=UPI00131CB81B